MDVRGGLVVRVKYVLFIFSTFLSLLFSAGAVYGVLCVVDVMKSGGILRVGDGPSV